MWHSTPMLPACGMECYYCQQKNHFSEICRSHTKHHKVYSIAHDDTDPSDNFFICMLQSTTATTPGSILVNHLRNSFTINTGAQYNIISKSQYHQLSTASLQQWQVVLGGECLNTCGRVTIKCELKGKFYAVNFEVIKQEVQSILGLQTCVAMNLMQHLDVNSWTLIVMHLKDWVA